MMQRRSTFDGFLIAAQLYNRSTTSHCVTGSMPVGRYQHGAIFVGARLHISGGAIGGGRMVEDAASVAVLDTVRGPPDMDVLCPLPFRRCCHISLSSYNMLLLLQLMSHAPWTCQSVRSP
jgi:hypothetical protein